MALYRNKYRTETTRLKNWDYSRHAAYFITICTEDYFSFFGAIEQDEMHLSPIGQIVADEWANTLTLRPDMNLTLGAYVVMPNHFHAILIIGTNEYNTAYIQDEVDEPYQNKFEAQSKNLASIIRGFKSAVTVQARAINSNFAWQTSYHDHIIRNEQAYENISNYIQNNPLLWKKDRFYNL